MDDISAIVNDPRDLTKNEFWSLCWAFSVKVYFPVDKRTFREPADPIKMWSVIRECSAGEAKRRNVTASETFSAGVLDLKWGIVQAGKKDKELYIINPPEAWELNTKA